MSTTFWNESCDLEGFKPIRLATTLPATAPAQANLLKSLFLVVKALELLGSHEDTDIQRNSQLQGKILKLFSHLIKDQSIQRLFRQKLGAFNLTFKQKLQDLLVVLARQLSLPTQSQIGFNPASPNVPIKPDRILQLLCGEKKAFIFNFEKKYKDLFANLLSQAGGMPTTDPFTKAHDFLRGKGLNLDLELQGGVILSDNPASIFIGGNTTFDWRIAQTQNYSLTLRFLGDVAHRFKAQPVTDGSIGLALYGLPNKLFSGDPSFGLSLSYNGGERLGLGVGGYGEVRLNAGWAPFSSIKVLRNLGIAGGFETRVGSFEKNKEYLEFKADLGLRLTLGSAIAQLGWQLRASSRVVSDLSGQNQALNFDLSHGLYAKLFYPLATRHDLYVSLHVPLQLEKTNTPFEIGASWLWRIDQRLILDVGMQYQWNRLLVGENHQIMGWIGLQNIFNLFNAKFVASWQDERYEKRFGLPDRASGQIGIVFSISFAGSETLPIDLETRTVQANARLTEIATQGEPAFQPIAKRSRLIYGPASLGSPEVHYHNTQISGFLAKQGAEKQGLQVDLQGPAEVVPIFTDKRRILSALSAREELVKQGVAIKEPKQATKLTEQAFNLVRVIVGRGVSYFTHSHKKLPSLLKFFASSDKSSDNFIKHLKQEFKAYVIGPAMRAIILWKLSTVEGLSPANVQAIQSLKKIDRAGINILMALCAGQIISAKAIQNWLESL